MRAEAIARRRFLYAGLGASGALWLAGCGLRALKQPPALAPLLVDGAGSLKVHAAARKRFYGCAVNVEALANDPAYAELVKAQAGMIVAENAMKWAALRPAEGRFAFEQADALVAFAEAHAMKVRGHCLCWHRQLPSWFADAATVENARGLLLDHIRVVAGRYAGRLHSWDVVNEAVEVKDGRADGLRDSPWLRLVGPDYIETAFRATRAADPEALLSYNDYGLEGEDAGSEKKRVAVLQLLRRLKARGVPIDAVGLQAHLMVGDAFGQGMMAFLAAVRELGLQVFVTELDVNDRMLPAETTARDAAVGRLYGDFVSLVMQEPALSLVLTWGITDRYTWLRDRKDGLAERCLPFDGAGKPVAAFFAMRDAFDGKRVR